MNIKRLLLVVLCLIIITSGSIVLYVQLQELSPFALARTTVPYQYRISTTSGFDLGNDSIRLGDVKPGTANRRHVELFHETATTLRVRIYGNGSEFLFPEYPEYALDGKPVNVTLIAAPPFDAPAGAYAGYVEFIFLR